MPSSDNLFHRKNLREPYGYRSIIFQNDPTTILAEIMSKLPDSTQTLRQVPTAAEPEPVHEKMDLPESTRSFRYVRTSAELEPVPEEMELPESTQNVRDVPTSAKPEPEAALEEADFHK
jgi:hypothetical protein